MKTLSAAECASWCKSLREPIVASGQIGLTYEDGASHSLAVSVPLNSLERVALSYSLLSFPAEDAFLGGILWFKEWNIGPTNIERVGWKVVEQMRHGYGQTASLENAPGQKFRRDEFVDAHAFLLQAMSFEWDAFFVPALSDNYIFISHRQVAYCMAHDANVLAELCSHLSHWGPKNDLPFFLQPR